MWYACKNLRKIINEVILFDEYFYHMIDGEQFVRNVIP